MDFCSNLRILTLFCITIVFGGGLRDVRVANDTGTIVTVAGNGSQGYSGDNGLAINAELYFPYDVFVDSHGNIFVSDALNNRVRKIDSNTGIITTIAGNGTKGYSGDGGLAIDATFFYPESLYVDSQGTLFITDYYNNVVRKVNATTGIITTIIGNGTGDTLEMVDLRQMLPCFFLERLLLIRLATFILWTVVTCELEK